LKYIAKLDDGNPFLQDWETDKITTDDMGYPISVLLIQYSEDEGDGDALMKVPVDERVCTVVDHLIIDDETGEAIGMVCLEGFDANTPDGAEWVMQKMAETRAKAEYWDQRPEVIMARQVIANAEQLAKQELGRLRYLEWRFKPELGKYVQGLIDSKAIKTKTWRCLYGTIARKIKPATVKVIDEEYAVAAALQAFPDAVEVTKRFYISKLSKDERAWLLEAAKAGDDELLKKAFAYEAGDEETKIEAGAKL
jgi:hypothetical protein